MQRNWIVGILVILLILATVGGVIYYYIFLTDVTDQPCHLYIYPEDRLKDVLANLEEQECPEDIFALKLLLENSRYQNYIKSGHYLIPAGATPYEVYRKLYSGDQDPVKLVIGSHRFFKDIISQIAPQLSLDSPQLMMIEEYLFKNDTLIDSSDEILTTILPNTYSVYWDITAEELAERIIKEHYSFWSDNEKQGALEDLQMSETEAYILASIVERETLQVEEMSVIAGVYLNRLKKNMKLQADPTVVYANQDFKTRRVLRKDTEIDHPYNTYKYQGLPPGPIGTALPVTIQEVLKYSGHDYYYFCAAPDFSGRHLFASTYSEHLKNARQFHRWLDQQNIR